MNKPSGDQTGLALLARTSQLICWRLNSTNSLLSEVTGFRVGLLHSISRWLWATRSCPARSVLLSGAHILCFRYAPTRPNRLLHSFTNAKLLPGLPSSSLPHPSPGWFLLILGGPSQAQPLSGSVPQGSLLQASVQLLLSASPAICSWFLYNRASITALVLGYSSLCTQLSILVSLGILWR